MFATCAGAQNAQTGQGQGTSAVTNGMADSQLSAQTNQTIQNIGTLLTTLGECKAQVDALIAANGTITKTMNKISDGQSKFIELYGVLNQHGHIQILRQRNIICARS